MYFWIILNSLKWIRYSDLTYHVRILRYFDSKIQCGLCFLDIVEARKQTKNFLKLVSLLQSNSCSLINVSLFLRKRWFNRRFLNISEKSLDTYLGLLNFSNFLEIKISENWCYIYNKWLKNLLKVHFKIIRKIF